MSRDHVFVIIRHRIYEKFHIVLRKCTMYGD